jgi:hypothetical protein
VGEHVRADPLVIARSRVVVEPEHRRTELLAPERHELHAELGRDALLDARHARHVRTDHRTHDPRQARCRAASMLRSRSLMAALRVWGRFR